MPDPLNLPTSAATNDLDAQSISHLEALKQGHQALLDRQKTFGFYHTHDLRLVAFPDVFHPEPNSSSLFLLDALLAHIPLVEGDRQPAILEIGCGTGVVGIGLRRHTKNLYLSDIDPAAVWCTRFNALINGVKANCYVSDLFAALPQRQFDRIIFNLPLLHQPINDSAERTTNDPGGLIFKQFIQDLPQFLARDGVAYFGYATIGDMQLLAQIPDTFKLDRIASEAFPEFNVERYVFALTLRQ